MDADSQEVKFMGLKNKVAIITGAAGGIGSVSAKRFAKEGAKVLVTDIQVEGGHKTVKEIKDNGGEAAFVEADITKVSECEKIIMSAIDTFSGIDVLFNMAGIEGVKALHECTEEDYDNMLDSHLKGTFFCIRYVLPELMARGGGAIINMGSTAGCIGHKNIPHYCAAKGAIVNLSRYVALDYAAYNIRCNCICPGVVGTGMVLWAMKEHPDMMKRIIEQIPMGRVAKPEEIADAAVFLASDESSYITGVTLPIDGGDLAGKI